MQKKIIYILMIVFVVILSGSSVLASEIDIGEIDTNEIIESQLDLFDWNDLEAVQEQLLEESPYLQKFDLREEVTGFVKGEQRFSISALLGAIANMFLAEIGMYTSIIIRFILVVLLCNMLQALSSSFEAKNTTKVAFFVCYITILYTVIESLVMLVMLAQTTIDSLQQIMLVALPTLLAFMSASGYIASSAAMAPVAVAGLNIVVSIIQKVILPSIVGVVLLQMVSSMSSEFKVDKFIKLFYKVSKRVLQFILFMSVGIMGIYKMSLPYVDVTMRKVGVNLSARFIPVLGSAVGGVVDLILHFSGLIKNAFALGIIIWVVIIVCIPLIKMVVYILLYNVAAAAIEPLGDKKMANIASDLAKGCEFIMSCVGIVTILCIAVLVICISVGASIV